MSAAVEALVHATWFAPLGAAAAVAVAGAALAPTPVARRTPPPSRHRRRRFGSLRRAPRPVPSEEPWPSLRRTRPACVDPSAVATWVDELARDLRRGSTLRAALVDVGPTDPALLAATETFRRRLSRGALVADAARAWHAEVESDSRPFGPGRKGRGRADRHLATVATVLATAAEVGGGVGEPLDRLAAAMRQAAADDLDRSTQSAQARLSAHVLTFVPFAVLGLLLVVDDDVRAVATTSTGAGVVAAGVTLNLLGGVWMRRIVGVSR